MTIAQDMAAETEVEFRCPDGAERHGYCHPGKLLAKLRLAGGRPLFVQPDNLIELPCAECRNRLRREDKAVRHVYHRYDMLGTHMGTRIAGR